jgi:hypothetical protein
VSIRHISGHDQPIKDNIFNLGYNEVHDVEGSASHDVKEKPLLIGLKTDGKTPFLFPFLYLLAETRSGSENAGSENGNGKYGCTETNQYGWNLNGNGRKLELKPKNNKIKNTLSS